MQPGQWSCGENHALTYPLSYLILVFSPVNKIKMVIIRKRKKTCFLIFRGVYAFFNLTLGPFTTA